MNVKNIFYFLIYLILNPKYSIYLFSGIANEYIQYKWLQKYNIKTFIDVGANKGMIFKVINMMFPQANIYAFEPIPVEYNSLLRKTKKDNIIIEPYAISNVNGNFTFYINDFNPASSLLQLSDIGAQKHKFLKNVNSIDVKTMTLDEYFKDKSLEKNVLLKIDVQGAEQLVLEGGQKILQDIDIIILEISYIPIYENSCSFDDIYKILSTYDFIYSGSIRESEYYPIFKLKTQENCIFLKKSIYDNYIDNYLI